MDGLPIYHGLDITAATAMIDLLNIEDKEEMLDRLLIMESAALPVIREAIAAKR